VFNGRAEERDENHIEGERTMNRTLLLVVVWMVVGGSSPVTAAPLRIGVFDVDASPPVGSPLAYDPTKGVLTPLSCRGVVLVGAGEPIVLCAIDWIGTSNGGYALFRESLAAAAGTDPARVAVHAIHQHDAPLCDFATDELLQPYGLGGKAFDPVFARDVIRRAAEAVRTAVENARPCTHVGQGTGIVENVASNRRILGPDGRVQFTRWTATKDAAVRDMPVGTIDPVLKTISFWADDKPLAALTYYATHPQSYYRTGLANPDFPGLARNQRQADTDVPHIHFTGAGGNIGAGKWNDGSPENRQVLADRVAAGMRRAWEDTRKTPISAEDVGWSVVPVALPVAAHLDESKLRTTIEDASADVSKRWYAAEHLVWLKRCQAGDRIDVSCLKVATARVLHLPGELFVEYQLAAQQLRPDLFVAMAAYGDGGPGYIGTEVAYSQGGYETSPGASLVAPSVEDVLMGAMRKLLECPE
jgi:hypothetical protein